MERTVRRINPLFSLPCREGGTASFAPRRSGGGACPWFEMHSEFPDKSGPADSACATMDHACISVAGRNGHQVMAALSITPAQSMNWSTVSLSPRSVCESRETSGIVARRSPDHEGHAGPDFRARSQRVGSGLTLVHFTLSDEITFGWR